MEFVAVDHIFPEWNIWSGVVPRKAVRPLHFHPLAGDVVRIVVELVLQMEIDVLIVWCAVLLTEGGQNVQRMRHFFDGVYP